MDTNYMSKNLPCAGPTIIVAHGWPSQANSVHYMWHLVLFSHFFLRRWRFVVHAAIDGYSRLVVYNQISTNNQASTVLKYFMYAISRYGVSEVIMVVKIQQLLCSCSCSTLDEG